MTIIPSTISPIIRRSDDVGREDLTTADRNWPGSLRSAGLIAGVLVIFVGCQRGERPVSAAVAPPPSKVLVSYPVERPLTETREYTGHLEAVETVSIRARVRGVLQQIHF